MHVLTVGSSVVDLFLTMNSDHVKIDAGKATFDLGDKVPSEIKKTALGGNGANVSVGLTRLEIPTTFYTYLGDDFFSKEIKEGLSQSGVELDVEVHQQTNSPLHIILDFPQDRIILSNYSKNQHDFNPKGKDFDFIFLTSIPDAWEDAYKKVLQFSKDNSIPLAFSPGTRQIESANQITLDTVKQTKIYFSNREEASKILNRELRIMDSPEGQKQDMKELLLAVKKLGPEVVSITDGAKGAYAIDKDNNAFFIEPQPSESTEKAGAGDGYAAAFLAGYLSGKDVPTSMLMGAFNSWGVMQQMGAQNGLLDKPQLDTKMSGSNNLIAQPI